MTCVADIVMCCCIVSEFTYGLNKLTEKRNNTKLQAWNIQKRPFRKAWGSII